MTRTLSTRTHLAANPGRYLTSLLVLFAILTIVSTVFFYHTHQQEVERRDTITLFEYENRGLYDYNVTLKPNTIYNNKTKLRPGEEPIFTKIVEIVEVDFNYTFQATKPANLTIQYSIIEYLETSTWQIVIDEVAQETINATEIVSWNMDVDNIPSINVSSITYLINKITQETGISISNYNVTILPEISIEANSDEGYISETFNPKLSVQFTSRVAGNVILIEGISHADNGAIVDTNIIPQPWINTQRNISYAMSIFSFPGLLATIWLYSKKRPLKPVKPEALIEELIDPYKELICEGAEEPKTSKTAEEHLTVISVKTLEDLVKIADMRIKPIIHTQKSLDTHIFWVIDETTRYEYTITETAIIEMTREKEE